MTKAEYIDFIRNSLPMVDKTDRFHPEQVAAAINNAINTAFYDLYKSNPKEMYKSMERYTTIVTGAPTINSTWKRYYTALTVDVVDLPRKTGGIIDVMVKIANIDTGDTWSTTTTCVPVSSIEGDQFYGSEGSLPDNVIGFSYNGSRSIEWWNVNNPSNTTFYIRLIKQFRSYASTDNIVLPYGQDEKIISLVREFLGVTPPKDIVNNEADRQQ